MNSRNVQMTMTRTVSPDNGHPHTCFITDAFLLKNTCSVDQRPEENADGHPKPATRYARTAPRRLLAARSKDPSAATFKIEAPQRQIKYRSLKRTQAPHEEPAVRSQRPEALSTRTLLAMQHGERTASERTETTRRSLFMERRVTKTTAEKSLSRKISELKVQRRGLKEIQPPSVTAAEQRTLAKEDVSRKTEMRTSQRTTERKIPQKDGSRRLALENQAAPKLPVGREFNVHRRASTERRSLLRILADHRLYQSDTTRKLSGARKPEKSVVSESRIRELIVPRTTSAKAESSTRILAEHRMLEYGNSRRISSERQPSLRLASDKISERLFLSRTSSKPNFSDTRLSRASQSDIRQDDSKHIRALSEPAQISRISTERFGSERRSGSRVAHTEARSYAERLLSRRNSLNEAGNSERRYSTKRFPEKSINSERISVIRRTARSISSHLPTNSRVSRTLPFTSITFRNPGRLYEERTRMMSQDRVFRSLPSVQLLSSSSELKENERQSSGFVSRITSGRQSVIISSDKPSSRTITDRTQASRISKERLPQISSNRLSPSRKSIDRTAVHRIADNRRISASALEEKRNMRLSHERRSLSSESSDRRSSFRKTEARQSSSDRSSPLNSIVTTRISEERRGSRASSTTRRLLTSSTVRLPARISERRLDQSVSSRLSEFTASRRISSERVLGQSSKIRKNVPPSVSDKRLPTDTPAYKYNHVDESTARQSIIRTSAERALILRHSKRPYAENIIALSDSSGVSTRRLTSEKDSRSTERLLSIRGSGQLSAKRLAPITGSRKPAERLKSSKFSGKISVERLTSEKDPKRFAERLASVVNSMRISAERQRLSRSTENSAHAMFSRRVSEQRLLPERDSKRYDKGVESVTNSRRVSAGRLTPERQSRMSAEPFSPARDSMRIIPDSRRSSESETRFRDSKKLSSGRKPLEKVSRRSVEGSPSVRKSRTILTAFKNPTDSSKSEASLSLLNNSRKSVAERKTTQRYSKSTERLPFFRVSRAISRGPDNQRSSERSAERLATLRHSRIYVSRLTTQSNSRSAEHFTPLRVSSRTSTERLVTQHFRPVEHWIPARDSRSISTERLTSHRSAEQSGQFVTGTGSARSSERINFNRNDRITGESVASIRASRGISPEMLSDKRDSRVTSTTRTSRRTNIDFTSITRHRISPKQVEIQKNDKISAVHLALVRGSRSASTELLSQGSRRYVGRIPTVLSTRKTTARRQISERDSRRIAERSTYVRNPIMSSNRWASDRESRRTVKLLGPADSRKITIERDSSRSVEHLISVRNSRISAEIMTMRNSRRSVDRFSTDRNSRISNERIGSDRRSTDRLLSSRDFRRVYNKPLGSEMNSERSVVSVATNSNYRRTSTERLVSERNSKPSLGHLANLRNTRRLSTNGLSSVRNSKASADRLKSLRGSVQVSHERQAVSKESTPHHLATSRSLDRVSTRTISSERRISQPEPLSTIHITSKSPVHRDAARMSNVRNTRLAYGHVSKNQALHQGFVLSDKYFSTMDNTTLKTESLFGTGLSLEIIQKSVVGFMSAQYSNCSDKVIEYIKCVLASLTLMWPALAIWKEGVPASLISFDGTSAFLPKMDHLNSFFTDKVNCLHS